MPNPANGEVIKLTKDQGSYWVDIQFGTFGHGFKTSIPTDQEDPNDAIAVARQWLHDFGNELAKAFAEPGSLK